MAHALNLSFWGGGDQENHGSRPAQASDKVLAWQAQSSEFKPSHYRP
jgi:hypothetical protein